MILILILLGLVFLGFCFYRCIVMPAVEMSSENGLTVRCTILGIMVLIMLCALSLDMIPYLIELVVREPLIDTGKTIGAIACTSVLLHVCLCLYIRINTCWRRSHFLTAPWVWVLPLAYSLSKATTLVGDHEIMKLLDIVIAGGAFVVPMLCYKGFYEDR